MSDEDFPRPSRGDKLFTAGEDDWDSAYLSDGRRSWRHYADGYKIAGDILVQHTLHTRSNQEYLVYPIVFLYRHCIELELKGLFALSKAVHDEPLSRPPTRHPLMPLFNEARRAVKTVWPRESQEDLNVVEAYLREFDEYDPNSDAFRYPVDTKGKPALAESLERFSLRTLAGIVDGIYDRLGAILDGLDEYVDFKIEMESTDRPSDLGEDSY